MKLKLQHLLILLFLTFSGCKDAPPSEESIQDLGLSASEKQLQQEIIEEHLKNGAWKYQIYSQEWQKEIDKGLAKDSTIAYLWQQKAMPLIKQGKYEVGLDFLDKAVKYDRRKWQDYRAFTKCIFANIYKDAIKDFKDYKEEFGYGYVMDHSYDFYIALSYLQLNEFEKAEKIFSSDFDYIMAEKGEDWLHHLDLFYFGLSKYELEKYDEAIEMFDLALEIYPQFSDVQVYKAVCLRKLGRAEEAKKLDELAEINGRKGYTINEANAIYERYPYMVRWEK